MIYWTKKKIYSDAFEKGSKIKMTINRFCKMSEMRVSGLSLKI